MMTRRAIVKTKVASVPQSGSYVAAARHTLVIVSCTMSSASALVADVALRASERMGPA